MLQQQLLFNNLQPYLNQQQQLQQPMINQQQLLNQQLLGNQPMTLAALGGGGMNQWQQLQMAQLLQQQQQQPQAPGGLPMAALQLQAQPQAGLPFQLTSAIPGMMAGAPYQLATQAAQAPQQAPVASAPSTTPKASVSTDWNEPFAAQGKKEPPFPLKLHQILANPEFNECICWNPHGKSWRILKPPVFEQVVIPLYFRHAKYGTFSVVSC